MWRILTYNGVSVHLNRLKCLIGFYKKILLISCHSMFQIFVQVGMLNQENSADFCYVIYTKLKAGLKYKQFCKQIKKS